ncbi:MAG: S1 RNA-binding domain-containing protein, partial [Succinivibrio dextrinosolvens]|nr:S1 RNA-binding domain-containing protein [Succinivibrio dextrinosolvens]
MEDTPVLGHMIDLRVVDITDQGAFVDAGTYGDLFVPNKQLPDELEIGNLLRVFLYKDSGRVLATARHPYLECGMCGRLTVKAPVSNPASNPASIWHPEPASRMEPSPAVWGSASAAARVL